MVIGAESHVCGKANPIIQKINNDWFLLFPHFSEEFECIQDILIKIEYCPYCGKKLKIGAVLPPS